MKSRMHLVEIDAFSLNNVTVRPTRIMNRVDQNWDTFRKQSTKRPWDAHFFRKEKTRAAHNSCHFCYWMGWSENRAAQSFHFINSFISNFFGPNSKMCNQFSTLKNDFEIRILKCSRRMIMIMVSLTATLFREISTN